MDGIELSELQDLIEFLKANDIAEFDLEKGDLKLGIKFAGAGGTAPAMDMGQLARLMASSQQGVAAPMAQGSGAAAPVAAAGEAPAKAEEKLHMLKSPIVGTFYESPSPGSPPFVKVGDVVEVGQVLCIVEAMKLMNEIESDAAGEVVERMVNAGQPVEYGQSLFSIRAR